MGEPGTGRPRERWLRVVRDDEVPPPAPPPGPPAAPERSAPEGAGPARDRAGADGAAPERVATAPGRVAPGRVAPRHVAPRHGAPRHGAPRHGAPGPPAPGPGPGPAPGPGPGPPAVGGPRREPGSRTSVAAAAGRPAVARWAWVVGVPVVGTGLALGADRLVGGLDGRPALHLLIVLALPFWDALPHRLGPRLLALAGAMAGIAAAWLALAVLRPEPWWRAEVAFGLACALVGVAAVAVSALAGRGRTVDP